MDTFKFNDAKYQYLLSDNVDARFSNNLFLNNNLVLNYTSKTIIFSSENASHKIIIIGMCVDSYAELTREDISEYLLENVKCVNELTDIIGRLAGKFVIIFQNNKETYLVGDATASLPIYYYDQGMVAGSSEHVVATFLNLDKDPVAMSIQKLANDNMPLPYKQTHYKNLSFLLPNHCIELQTKQINRYFITLLEGSISNTSDILERSIFLIKNIVKGYAKSYDLICPLTAGTDSRVVLSFLVNQCSTECYTFDFEHFNREAAEVKIPQEICDDLGITHKALKVQSVTGGMLEEAYNIIGANNIKKQRIDLVKAIRDNYEGKAILNGDIIDQIGKSGTFGTTPICFSIDSYFTTKTHSFSRENAQQTSSYLSELKKYFRGEQIYDYFALEMRCGRWASQYSEVNNSLGVNMLNIFNCSELIALWMKIDRKKRSDLILHNYFLDSLCPKISKHPVNPDDKTKFLKNNTYLYPIASYLKFYLQKAKLHLKASGSRSK